MVNVGKGVLLQSAVGAGEAVQHYQVRVIDGVLSLKEFLGISVDGYGLAVLPAFYQVGEGFALSPGGFCIVGGRVVAVGFRGFLGLANLQEQVGHFGI